MVTDTETIAKSTAAVNGRLSSRDSIAHWARKWGVLLALCLVGLTSVVVNVSQHEERFSPYDEWVYYDYIEKVPTQGFVRQGEEIGEPALQGMACDGDTFGPRGEPCTGENGTYDEPELYPQKGVTSADIYTPAYFGTTWLGAQVVMFFTGADLLTAARGMGAFWLIAGLIVLVMLFRQFRIPNLTQLGLGLATIGLLMNHYAFTYISTDAPALLIGSSIALLGAKFAETGRFGWWLVAASSVAVLFKTTFLFPVALVALALVARAVFRLVARTEPSGSSEPSPSRAILIAISACASGVIAQLVWLAIRSANSVGPSPDHGLSVQLTLRDLVADTFVFLVPRTGINALSARSDLAMTPFVMLLIAGVIGWFVTSQGGSMSRAWSIATLVGAVLFAPAMAFAFQILMGESAPITPRYSLGIMPMFLVAVAMIIRNRTSAWLVLLYGAGIAAAEVLGLNS